MRKNNFLLQIQSKANQRLFWKSKKRNNRLEYDQKRADDNIIYKALKTQKDTDTILTYILNTSNVKKDRPVTHIRSRSYELQPLNQSVNEQKYSRSQSIRQRDTFREQAQKIVFHSKKISDQLEMSKKRIKILGKFNNKVESFCTNIIKTKDQQQNQGININQQLIKLQNQDLFGRLTLYQRASQCLKYQQPKIPMAKLKKLKQKYKLNLTYRNPNSFKRAQTQHF